MADTDAGEELNAYERARAELIARNRERMRSMGLLGGGAAAAAIRQGKAKASKPKQPRPRPPRATPQAPTRASERLRGEKTEGSTREEETEREPSPPPPPRWTEEQLRELRRDQELKMSERLSDLELSGLIDASPGVAHFAIVGAHHKGQKRKHYKVTLEGGGGGGNGNSKSKKTSSTSSCECVDFRIRRRKYGGHCKHIKLVLTQLGIQGEGNSDGWEEALERMVMG